MYDIDAYRKADPSLKISTYIYIDDNDTYYLITNKGMLPFTGDKSGIKRMFYKDILQSTFEPPTYDYIIKFNNQFDSYIINYKKLIIGGVYDNFHVYWKGLKRDD